MIASLAEQVAPEVRTLTQVPDLFAGSLAAYNRLRPLDPMTDHAAAVAGREHLVLPANLDAIQRSMQTPAGHLEAAVAESVQARRRDLAIFDTADIVLLPVAGGPACDESGKLDIDGESIFGWDIMGQCRAVTMVGGPLFRCPSRGHPRVCRCPSRWSQPQVRTRWRWTLPSGWRAFWSEAGLWD
jgi:amidase